MLSKLRRALGPQHIDGRSGLQLVLEAAAIVDVEAAAEAIHRAEAAVHRADFVRAWAPARIALHTAARGFLPGLEAPWVDERRRELDDLRLRALECVAHAGIGLGGAELDAALRSGRALIASSPYRESGHRLLMEALAAHGDVAEALLVWDRLRTSLRDDLGATASGVTAEVHRRLLAGSR